MDQPLGFWMYGTQPLVCHLQKALYGLKQTPRAQYERLSSCLHNLGFRTSKQADTSLLIHTTSTTCCYVLIYVDDIIVTGSSPFEMDDLIKSMHHTFALKDLGKLGFFLGVEVSYPEHGGMFLSQSKYIHDLLQRTKMVEAKQITTPMVNGPNLSTHQGEYSNDCYFYRSVVGALQYAILTHPKISYSVNKACQFMHFPTLLHWQFVKHI